MKARKDVLSQRDVLAEASKILQEPSKNTRRKILTSLNLILGGICLLHVITQLVTAGHLPDPQRDVIVFPIIISVNFISAIYQLLCLTGRREPSRRWDTGTRWVTILLFQLFAIVAIHVTPNTATAILFDNMMGILMIFLTGFVLGRKAAVVWFLIQVANITYAVKLRGHDFVYILMTSKEVASLRELQLHDGPAYAARMALAHVEKLDPLPLLLYLLVGLAYSLLSILPTYFESSMMGQVLGVLPDAIDKIQIAAKQKQHLEDENLRMSTELDVARRLQAMILPKLEELRNAGGLEVAAAMKPAAEIGGDLYDVLPHADGSTHLVIGDVTDHGLASGVVMLMAQAAIRTCLEDVAASLSQTLIYVNSLIYKNVQLRMGDFRNLTLGLLHYQNGRLKIAGQHEAVLLLRKDAPSVEVINTESLGFFVGMVDNIQAMVSEIEVEFLPGDLMVLYTDGVTEAENPKQEQYGQERLIEALLAARGKPTGEIMEVLVESVMNWMEAAPMLDDVTMVVVRKV